MRRVSGWYYDGRRFRRGTVGWEDGVIVETTSGSAREPLAKGLIIPSLWNAHTHLGDAVVTQELRGSIEKLVAPPHGLKHRVLAKAMDREVIAAMRRAVSTMLRTGTVGFCDFREGGLNGLKLLYASVPSLPVRTIILGRPTKLAYDRKQAAAILRACDGIGVSAYADWPADDLEKLAADANRAGKLFAIHASERIREDIDAVLDLKPSFLVHMVHATDSDLQRCADAGLPIVVCPRSNAFFGMVPDIPRMLRKGVELRLGTDNAMISSPLLLREMEFAYRIARLRGDVPAKAILQMALRGWRLTEEQPAGRIAVGSPADLVVFDVPVGSSGFASLFRTSTSDISLIVAGGLPWPRPSNRQRRRSRKSGAR